MKSIKIGDLVEIYGGHIGLVVGIEQLHPHHPSSPPRNFQLQFVGEKPKFATVLDKGAYSVDAFAVKRVVSESR